jgi:hypothetical protein
MLGLGIYVRNTEGIPVDIYLTVKPGDLNLAIFHWKGFFCCSADQGRGDNRNYRSQKYKCEKDSKEDTSNLL